MKLGDWISTLEALPLAANVEFDNGRVPKMLCSWRGVYAELTLDSQRDYGQGIMPMTVGELLNDARAAVGRTFEGYKGGEYRMDEQTPVWADEYGDYCSIGLMGARVEDGRVILTTADLSDYR